MKKIPTIFVRNPADPLRVSGQKNVACDWVFSGEGVATRKWDGQPLLFEGGLWYKRYTGDLRGFAGNPLGAIQCGEEEDTTPIWWVLVDWSKQNQHILEAIRRSNLWSVKHSGTYEICGPSFCHNREGFDEDRLIKHGAGGIFPQAPVTFVELRDWLQGMDVEGLVWHHPDGRMAKIKKLDFGLRRKPILDNPPTHACHGPKATKIPVAEVAADMDDFKPSPIGEAEENTLKGSPHEPCGRWVCGPYVGYDNSPIYAYDIGGEG